MSDSGKPRSGYNRNHDPVFVLGPESHDVQASVRFENIRDIDIMKPNIHSLCDDCYEGFYPHGQEPLRKRFPLKVGCCECKKFHRSGIYVSLEAKLVACKGNHV